MQPSRSPQSTCVLVLEDEVSLNRILCDELTRRGFAVLDAYDGEEGLKIALHQRPDIILLDLKMPKVDGKTFLKQIRADEWGKEVPVLVATNVDTIEDMNECMSSRVEGYFIKSNVSLDTIFKTIEQINI